MSALSKAVVEVLRTVVVPVFVATLTAAAIGRVEERAAKRRGDQGKGQER